MRAFYIGPAPFWYLWFSVPDNLESAARTYVSSVGPWFQFHNDDTRKFTPWKVRMCSLVAAGAVLADPPAMREWSWPLPPPDAAAERENIYIRGHQLLIGSASPLEPAIAWGPMSLAYYVRDEFPVLPKPTDRGPWRLWFAGPLRGQAFYRSEIDKTGLYWHGAAGSTLVEAICLDGIVPPNPTDEFLLRNHALWG